MQVSFYQCLDLRSRVHEVKFDMHAGILTRKYSQIFEDLFRTACPAIASRPIAPSLTRDARLTK
jgi:hypothetical protein